MRRRDYCRRKIEKETCSRKMRKNPLAMYRKCAFFTSLLSSHAWCVAEWLLLIPFHQSYLPWFLEIFYNFYMKIIFFHVTFTLSLRIFSMSSFLHLFHNYTKCSIIVSLMNFTLFLFHVFSVICFISSCIIHHQKITLIDLFSTMFFYNLFFFVVLFVYLNNSLTSTV